MQSCLAHNLPIPGGQRRSRTAAFVALEIAVSRWPTQGVSPSRRDQKQIIAFLRPELAEAAHRRARQEGVTLREVIGEAINAAYAKTGRQPPFQDRKSTRLDSSH